MSRRPKAVIFDLDDTLYRERRFILSGFRAVARTMAAEREEDASLFFASLLTSLRRGDRATALQALCASQGWPSSTVSALVDVIRTHRPALRLPLTSEYVLEQLRPAWRLGVVTNGPAQIQRRKVRALGVGDYVDTVVFATEHGSGRGKPDPEPFLIACARLGVEPGRCVFVGDDPVCDIQGARQVGMRTIRVTHGHGPMSASERRASDAVVRSVAEVPRLAEALLGEAHPLCA